MKEACIELYTGNTGNVDDIVKKYIEGNLEQNSDSNCIDHDNCSCEKWLED